MANPIDVKQDFINFNFKKNKSAKTTTINFVNKIDVVVKLFSLLTSYIIL